MSKTQFDILAALMLSGEATDTERREFEELLKTSMEKRIAFEKLKRVWHMDMQSKGTSYPKQREYLWQRYQRERYFQKGRTDRFFIKIAACILLLVSAGLSFYLVSKENTHRDQIAAVTVVEVVKETNCGERLKTRLPDGTIVLLNAGSQLVYPEDFSDSSRIVKLQGEGYFDVAEDANRPFTVQTQSMAITALGTAFGVNAYPYNLSDQVALVSGKLRITNNRNEELRLDSGYTVTLSRADYRFSKSQLDYLSDVAWKDGILYFNNTSFSQMIKTLELNYGVNFTMESQGMQSVQDTYTGTFKNESLENIMNVLSFSMDFNFKINGKEVLIEKK